MSVYYLLVGGGCRSERHSPKEIRYVPGNEQWIYLHQPLAADFLHEGHNHAPDRIYRDRSGRDVGQVVREVYLGGILTATTQAAVSGTAFDEILPDAPINSIHEYAESPYKRMAYPEPCFNCNQPTRWESVALNLRACSPDCADALWDAYFYAVESVGGVSVGFVDD